jgi:hypothetical protein
MRVLLVNKKQFIFFPLAPTVGHGADFSVPLVPFTHGRTPWTGDQLVARPLPKHRATQTQNKCIHTHTPNIHALCGIRTHDPGFQANEDSTHALDLSATVIGIEQLVEWNSVLAFVTYSHCI